MLATYERIWGLLTPPERRRAALLLALILVMGITQMAGVASVLPFVSLAASPQAVESNAWLASAYALLGFSSTQRFLLFLGAVVFAGLVMAILVKALTVYALTRFTEALTYALSRKLMAGYLAQPYDWFLSRHSADLGKTVLSEAELVIQGALQPALQLIAEGVVVVTLVVLLILIEPRLATAVAVVLGGAYALIYMSLRGFLKRTGADRVSANHDRFAAVQEAFGSIKDVKVAGLEGVMLARFDAPARRYTLARATEVVAQQMPRFALEALAFGGLLAVVIYLLAGPGGLKAALPTLAAYAFAAYRLMPSLQQFYAMLVRLRFAGPALGGLHADLARLTPQAGARLPRARARPLGLKEGLSLEGVTYAYPGAGRAAVKGIDLAVRANTTVGLVGRTGAGKTTTVDIILGLLTPQDGVLRVDGTPIGSGNLRAWQASVGYVPQQIYLADASIAANIAFGVPPGEVDSAAVERAARIANLHDFVTQELPRGYDTAVGERGARLSGGQRQRIGIARALYHDPALLVLDEATSALDTLTEQAVMEAVHNLAHAKTLIIIAHRLTTVRNCDTVVLMEAGRVAAQGPFGELAQREGPLRQMVTGARG